MRRFRIGRFASTLIEGIMLLWYLIGVPVLGALYLVVYFPLLSSAVAIGDTDKPVLSFSHSLALAVLSFPMLTLWRPLGGDVLKKWLTDNGTMFLFAVMNAVNWGAAGTWLLSLACEWIW